MNEINERKTFWQTARARTIAGQSQTSRRSIFSTNSRLVLSACGKRVRAYSTDTGEVVGVLLGHTAPVTELLWSPMHPAQLYTASVDGLVAVWDCSKGVLLKSINFATPVLRLGLRPVVSESGFSDSVSVFLAVHKELPPCSDPFPDSELPCSDPWPCRDIIVVGLSGLVLTDRKTTFSPHEALAKATLAFTLGEEANELTFTHNGHYLVSHCGTNLLVYDVDEKHLFKYKNSREKLTSVACHPSQLCIATGNAIGEIIFWYNFGHEQGCLVTTLAHWHAHAVADLCFSTDGSYLLSGGEESVLVLWQMGTERKHFLPRLGSAIVTVACSPEDLLVAVGMKNNVIKLVCVPSNEVVHTLGSLRKVFDQGSAKTTVKTGLVVDPISHCLVLDGSLGSLQFYDPEKDIVRRQVEVVHRNLISRPFDTPLTPTTIDHVAFSADGAWIAMAVSWDNGQIAAERRLEFWRFSNESQCFQLNTCIEPPHQKTITGIRFRPVAHKTWTEKDDGSGSRPTVAVSTSLDGKFKVWLGVEGEEMQRKGVDLCWACRSVGYYHDLPCYGAAFSEDGSLLAINFGKFLTVWDPFTCEIQVVFNTFQSGDEFVMSVFGCCSSSRFLMAASYHHLHVWDLLTCSLLWTVRQSIDILLSDPHSALAAAITHSNVIVFDPHYALPLAVHRNPSSSTIIGAVFRSPCLLPVASIGQDGQESQLIFMDERQLLYSLDHGGYGDSGGWSESLQGCLPGDDSHETNAYTTSFEFFQQKTSDLVTGVDVLASAGILSKERLLEKVFNMPSHVLPSMRVYCQGFLSTFLSPTRSRIIENDMADVTQDGTDSCQEQENGYKDMSTSSKAGLVEEMDGEDANGEDEETECIRERIGDYSWLVEFFQTTIPT